MSAPVSIMAVLAAFGVHAAASAQPYPTPPAPAAPRPLSVQAPIEQTLTNGMRLVLAERRGVRLVTAQLLVLSGSEVDPPQLGGLAAMTASLLTKGTRTHNATALASAAETLGGSLDSGAGWNRSAVSITVAEPLLDAALDLVADVVMQPTFAQAELDRARTQALDELKVGYSQPATLASLAANRLIYGDTAYAHPASGTPASLPRISRDDLVTLHRTYYRPDNAVLVLAGDIDAPTARRLANKHFARWRANGKALAPVAPIAAKPLETTIAAIDMPQSGQAGVVLAVPAPPSNTDRATGQVANAVLGGDYSSRLNQEIRIKRGLSYAAFSGLDARRQAGTVRASVQTKNESASEVVGLVQAEFERLIATPVPDDELSARKTTLIGTFSRSVETTAGLGGAVASLVVAGVPTDDLGKRIGALQAVSAADVQRYAKAYFGADKRRVVVAGDASKFDASLKAAAPNLLSIKADSLDLENPKSIAR